MECDTDLNELCREFKTSTNLECGITNTNSLISSLTRSKNIISNFENTSVDDIYLYLFSCSYRYVSYLKKGLFSGNPLDVLMNKFQSGMQDKILFDNKSLNNWEMVLLSFYIDETISEYIHF